MIRVAHRINQISELNRVPVSCGIEVDIRSLNGELMATHDPFSGGEPLNQLLKHYKHKLLILNVKEDGLEEAILELPNFPRDTTFFFLDQPFPTLLKSQKKAIPIAVRVSEYEVIPKLPQPPKWIWIDSFTGDWRHLESVLDYASKNHSRTCLVAPELQHRFDPSETSVLKEKFGIKLDAVCTKNLELWS